MVHLACGGEGLFQGRLRWIDDDDVGAAVERAPFGSGVVSDRAGVCETGEEHAAGIEATDFESRAEGNQRALFSALGEVADDAAVPALETLLNRGGWFARRSFQRPPRGFGCA